MIRRVRAVSLLLVGLCCCSCGKRGVEEERFEATEPVVVTEEARAVAGSVNEFAFGLYGELKGREGNLFFSPAGISTALAMAYAGAGGETKAQMAEALRLKGADEEIHAGFGTLGRILNSGGEGYRLRSANRLFGAEGSPFAPAFLGLVKKEYGAEPASLDFGDSEGARREINGWVSEQTNERIPELVKRGVLSPQTRLVLANAVYFKGRWEEEFRPKYTKDAPFRLAGGGEATVPLMRQKEHYRYFEGEGLQVVELPYRESELSMLVLLPEEVGLAGLEEKLTAEAVAGWVEGLGQREVDLFLPRFEMREGVSLPEALSGLGMPLAFDREQADFSGMTGGAEPLFLSEVVHEAFVAVDEQGTEAAAATAGVAAAGAAVQEEKPAVFRADRPFVFLIRDGRTGAVLFLGRLVDPRG